MKLSRSVACAAVGAFVVAACSSNGVTLGLDIDASLPDLEGGLDSDGGVIILGDSGSTHADAGKDGGAVTGEDAGNNNDSGTVGKDAGPPAPTCTDKIQNEGETDVDCGGPNCPKCPDTKKCTSGSDCTSSTCIAGVCGEASCTDTIKDGTETDVDCGGASCPPCADSLACKVGSDCTSGVCDPAALTCTPATCTDGVKNEGETAIDCGGPNCTPCADGLTCTAGTDCIDGVCNVTCQAPTCTDNVQNEGETDVDCGGPHCSPCADGKMCTTGADCVDGVCAGTCQAPSCTDGIKNEGETDVDCGGPHCGPCADGDTCATGTDCIDGVCAGGKCVTPSCTDGIRNGAETGVDCGGGTCPRCDIGQGCTVASDCDYNVCTAGVCQNAVSCATSASGTDTCGAAGNDNCCATLPVPGGTIGTVGPGKTGWSVSPYKLDKYEITVGRMRAFLESQSWDLIDHPPAPGSGAHAKIANSGWQSVWNNRLPKGQSNVLARAGIVGGNATQDSGTSGCYGGEDASTWTNSATSSDAKVANCFDWYTLQAFCIWDGGYLPTEREWQFAAQGGTEVRTFAWGTTPKDTDYMPGCNINNTGTPACTLDSNTYTGQAYTDAAGTVKDGTYTFPTPPGEWVVHAFCENDGDRWCFSYTGTNANLGLGATNGSHVAPPGQKLDLAKWGQYDMSGNLIEWTLDNSVNINAATGDQQTEAACVGADCANVDWVVYTDANKDPQGKAIVGDESVPGNPAYWRNYSYDTGTSGSGPDDLDARYQQDGGRVMRGGSWEIAHPINVSNRYGNYPVYRSYYAAGARCARPN